MLADLLRCNYLPSVWVPTPDVEDNRAIAARRTALVHERTSIRNRIHSVLARRLVAAPEGDLFSGKGLTYALPRATDEKLAALRVKATGEKRKRGVPKGVKSVSKIGGGKSRTTPALDEVYAREGLPSRRPRTRGEERMIRESGTERFVVSLDKPKVVAKK